MMKGLREVRFADRIFSAMLSIGVLCLMVVGCIPENIELPGTTPLVPLDTIVSPDVPPTLEVLVPDGAVNYFIDGITFERTADEVSMMFRTEEDWTVKVVDAVGNPVTWCRLSSALGGAGLHNVKVSVDENMGKSSRTARVVLMAFEDASRMAVIEISQEGTALFLKRTSYEVSSADTTIAVELQSNVDFEYRIEDGVDWVREQPSSSRALTAHAMAFAVDANPSYRSREACVFFNNARCGMTDTLTLVQQGLTPTLTVPEGYTDYFANGLVFDNSAGETEAVFYTNIYWTMQVVSVDGGDVSWCSVDSLSGGVGLHKLKVSAARNEAYSHRSALLYLMCDSIPLGEIQVTQNQKVVFSLDQREYQVSGEAAEVEVTLSTNVAFEYTILGGDWVRERQSATRGLTAHRLVFEIDANPSYELREAKIAFHNSEHVVSDTLTIAQKGLISVTTGDATNVTATSAELAGEVYAANQYFACGILYGTSPELSSTNGTKKSTTSKGAFSISVTGLQSGTTYYYCAFVMDNGEYKYGDVKSFTTTNIKVEAVDLGLSVKWASYNVGASSSEEYGDYFAWGETDEKSDYSWTTYKWCTGNSSTMKKYCTQSSNGTVDYKTTLDLEDDVAHVRWGGSWRMPTQAEIKELCDKCTWTWTSVNGVSGYKVSGNGNSIFLPAAGCRGGTGGDDRGNYWSGTLIENYSSSACNLYFSSGYHGWSSSLRYYGYTVRPVTE